MVEDPTAPQREMGNGGNRFPIPDPTVLTTQQILRITQALREVIDTRLAAMDKAVSLIQAAIDRSPSVLEVYAEVKEKFRSVQTQFTERDIRTEQTSRDSKVAVDAALQAAKEAVGEQNKSSALAIAKSEAATTKQIDQITALINAMTSGFDGKINDLKERLTRIEGHSKGEMDIWGYVVGVAGLLVGFGVLVLRVMGH